jgi:hypothetical protein
MIHGASVIAVSLLGLGAVSVSTADTVKGRVISSLGTEAMIWTDPASATETLKLIQVGVDPSAPRLKRAVSCVVPNRSRVSLLQVIGYGQWYEVVVLDGQEAGCKGVVPGAWFIGGE